MLHCKNSTHLSSPSADLSCSLSYNPVPNNFFFQCFNFCQNFPLHVSLSLQQIKKVHKEAGLYESIFFPGLTAVKKYIPTLNLYTLSKRHSSPSLPYSNTEDDFPVDNFWLIFKVPCTRHLTLLRFGYCNSLKIIKLYYRCTQKI